MIIHRKRAVIITFLLILSTTMLVYAQGPGGGRMRHGKMKRWSDLSENERSEYKSRLKRWREMDPEKRRRILNNFKRYQSLPEERKREVRKNFEQWRSLEPHRRKAVKDRWERRRGRGGGPKGHSYRPGGPRGGRRHPPR